MRGAFEQPCDVVRARDVAGRDLDFAPFARRVSNAAASWGAGCTAATEEHEMTGAARREVPREAESETAERRQ